MELGPGEAETQGRGLPGGRGDSLDARLCVRR